MTCAVHAESTYQNFATIMERMPDGVDPDGTCAIVGGNAHLLVGGDDRVLEGGF